MHMAPPTMVDQLNGPDIDLIIIMESLGSISDKFQPAISILN